MPLLEIRGLNKRFGGLQAVRGLDMSVEAGEIVGLIGPNGAGKTTIFNLITAVYPPTSGDVFFKGQPITHLPTHQICRLGIGRTFQVTKPFPFLTVLETVMIGAFNRTGHRGTAEAEGRRVLTYVGLEHRIDSLGKDLTVPQRKRLEVARALATKPDLLLLDEVAAGLTPSEVAQMIDLIKDIAATGVAMLVIEHVLRAVMSVSQRVVVLHHGEKIADAPPSQIGRDPKVVEAYLGEEYLIA